MPKFVIEREIPGAGNLTEAQLREVSQKSVQVLKGLGPEIQWLHSYVTGDKVYCVYLAPDEAIIQEHAKRVGIPANRISAVRRLLDPTMAGYAQIEYVRDQRQLFPTTTREMKSRVSAPLQSLSRPAKPNLLTIPSYLQCRSTPPVPLADLLPVWLVPPA